MKNKIYLLIITIVLFFNDSIAQEYDGIISSSSLPNLEVRFESCFNDGKLTTIIFSVKNTGNPFRMVNIGTRESYFENNPNCITHIVDDDGNSYIIRSVSLGEASFMPDSDTYPATISINLPANVWVKGRIGVLTRQSAKSFQKVNIGFLQKNGSTFSGYCFSFKNVPIFYTDQAYE